MNSMEAEINFRNINARFSHSSGSNEGYDGHLTIYVRWDGFYPMGRNPLVHKELKELVKRIKPILIEKGLSKNGSVVNCSWGEWKNVTFQYVKEENQQAIFDEFIKIAKELI